MYVDLQAAESREQMESITTGDGELIVSLSDEVAVRGTVEEVTLWTLAVMRQTALRCSQDELMAVLRSMMMEMMGEISPAPDDLSGL